MIKKLPKIFIGSTVKGLELAELIQEQLSFDYEVRLWNQGIFQPGNSNLQSLIDSTRKFDFAVFIFTFDDFTTINDHKYKTVRDNVIFEYGLFTGSLGSERTWFILDSDITEEHLPTDLKGINPIEYKKENRDINTVAGTICTKLKRSIVDVERNESNEILTNSRIYQEFKEEKLMMINNICENLKTNNYDFLNCEVIALDIDSFEHINRIFGIEAGNKVIEKAENIIRWFLERIFEVDQYYFTRFYSDEFFVIIKKELLKTPQKKLSLEDFANAIVAEIKGYKWNHLIPNLYLSCSAGFTTPNRNENIEECLVRALYATKIAKKFGGNSACPAPIVHDPRYRKELFYGCSLKDYYWRIRNNVNDLDY